MNPVLFTNSQQKYQDLEFQINIELKFFFLVRTAATELSWFAAICSRTEGEISAGHPEGAGNIPYLSKTASGN